MALPTPRIGSFLYPGHFIDWQTIEPPQLPQPNVKVYHQDGVDDFGALIGSKESKPWVVATEYHAATQSQAWAAIQSYLAIVGTLVNCVDEFGITWRGVLVMPLGHKLMPTLTPTEKFSAVVLWTLLPSVP
jgi:hypothetical protein